LTGQYKSWVNLKDDNESFSPDLDKVSEWTVKPPEAEAEEVNVVIIPASCQNQPRLRVAKEQELQN